MADARQLRLDSERAFRLARAGCRKFFDELNDLGSIFSCRRRKSSARLRKVKSRAEKTILVYIFLGDSCRDRLHELGC